MYPPPYQGPPMPQYYGAPVDALRPARRASLLMFIVGPLILLMATCLFSMPAIMNASPTPQVEQLRSKVAAQTSVSFDTLCRAFGAIVCVPGLLILVLAFFVRTGGKVATILSAVVVGLVSLLLILETIGGLVQASDPNALMGLCVLVPCTAVLILQFVWLIQAAVASGNVQSAQQQYAQQYWQYQQTMQAYANAGYGYQTQPQASPPAAAPASVPPPLPPRPSDQPPT